MIPIKNCGNCKYFQKVPGYGICMAFDWRTQSDHGRNCKSWKGIKYDRNENKKNNEDDYE
jgi:hypothetical protein